MELPLWRAPGSGRLGLAAGLAMSLVLSAAPSRAEESATPVNGLGVSLPSDSLVSPAADLTPWLAGWRSPSSSAPVYLRVVVPDLALDRPLPAPLLSAVAERGLVPILVLEPPAGEPRALAPDFDVDAWVSRLDRFFTAGVPHPLLVEILENPSERVAPRFYAYLVKRVAVSLRAIDPNAVIATGPIAHLSDVEALAQEDITHYVDALTLDASLPMEDAAATARVALPGVPLWVDRAGGASTPFLQQALGAFSHGFAIAVAASGAAPPPEELAGWRASVAPGVSVVPAAYPRLRVTDEAGQELPPGSVVELDAGPERGRLVALFGAAGRGTLRFEISGPGVSEAWLVDPATGEEALVARAAPATQGAAPAALASRLSLAFSRDPALLRLTSGAQQPLPTVTEDVHGQRALTLEEILARHRQYRAAQDRAVGSFVADVRIQYHFSLADFHETFDVVTVNRYYSRGGRGEYEEREIYINGSRWQGQKPPGLPFIVPERITEVPLDLRLDEQYRYRLEGPGVVDGRPAWIVAFEPLDESAPLYRGRVWIDAAFYGFLSLEAVQRHLSLPLISNELTESFAPVDVDGREWWLMKRVRGQMVFTALGRNVVLERTLSFSDFHANPPDLDQLVRDAYASEYPILQESPGGTRRLEKVPSGDGGWTVREPGQGAANASRLLVGAMSVGEQFDVGFPIVGVNYFNLDWRGTGHQLDVAWAGPFVDVVWSNPRFAGTKAILALEARLNPVPTTSKQLDPTGLQIGSERLDLSQQRLFATLGYPLGVHNKLQAGAELQWLAFDRNDKTAADFTLPADTAVGVANLAWTYNRGGFRSEWGIEAASRSRWPFWGPAIGSDYRPSDRSYRRGSMVLNKSFHFRRFDHLNTSLSLFEGSGLDRFSMFELGDFGAAGVSGFNGAGIRFERGGVADLTYSVGFGGQLRLDFSATHGRFLNRLDYGRDPVYATGVATAVNFAGPWNTFVRVRLSYGADASMEELDHNASLRLTVFRPFDRWFWQRGRGQAGPQGAPVPGTKKNPGPLAGTGADPVDDGPGI